MTRQSGLPADPEFYDEHGAYAGPPVRSRPAKDDPPLAPIRYSRAWLWMVLLALVILLFWMGSWSSSTPVLLKF